MSGGNSTHLKCGFRNNPHPQPQYLSQNTVCFIRFSIIGQTGIVAKTFGLPA